MSAEDPTASELLTACNAAIYSIVTNKAQSVSFQGRNYTYLDLADLRSMRDELQKEVRISNNSGSSIRLADLSGS